MELIYSHTCPYCRTVAKAVGWLDYHDTIDLTPIESDRGRGLIEDHHGEYVHTPHFFTDDLVYYGIKNTAWATFASLVSAYTPSGGKSD